jgi:hypothetical protein
MDTAQYAVCVCVCVCADTHSMLCVDAAQVAVCVCVCVYTAPYALCGYCKVYCVRIQHSFLCMDIENFLNFVMCRVSFP